MRAALPPWPLLGAEAGTQLGPGAGGMDREIAWIRARNHAAWYLDSPNFKFTLYTSFLIFSPSS